MVSFLLSSSICTVTVTPADDLFATSNSIAIDFFESGTEYITDGKVNATLPKDLDYKSVDLKQAIELINNKKAKKK